MKIMLLIGCGVLTLVMCAPVAGQTAKVTLVKPVSPDSQSSPSESTNEPSSNAEAVPQASPDEGWEFFVTPHFFLAGLDGTIGVVGQRTEVSATFRDLFRNLDFAAMGQLEARKGNWSILGEAMYISLSGTRVTPSPFFSDIDVGVKETIIEPAIAYRVMKSEGGSIGLLAGVRFWRVKPHIVFQRSFPGPIDVEDSKSWADPIIGVRGVAQISPRVFLMGRFDAGGFGVSSDFTGQAFGGVGFRVKPRIELIGGYRYLRVDYFDEGFIFKTAMSGITLGAKFRL